MPRTSHPQNDGLQFRAFGVVPNTLNETERTVDAVAATESPVMMPDWDRMEMVPEILLVSGMKFPANRTVPLLNSHNRHDAEDVIGSATELRTVGKELLTRAVFSSAADGIYTRVKEGHLRDLSIGYKVEKKRFIPKDTSERIAGREFTGPINVVTSCLIREVSVTPIGADEQAKMRGLSDNPFSERKGFMLTKEQRDTLIARGMPSDLDDAAAVTWAIDNPAKEPARKEPPAANPLADDDARITSAVEKATERLLNQFKAEQEATRKLHNFIRSECERFGVGDKAQAVIDGSANETEAGRKILDLLHEKQKAGPQTSGYIAFGADGNEKHGRAIGDALTVRMLHAAGKPLEKYCPEAKRQAGWEDFRHASLYDMARECVEMAGISIRGLTREQVAKLALGFQVNGQRGFHTTGSFPNLTLDAINKSLIAAYTETPATWRTCFRQAASVPDFKNIHRIRMSEFPNLSIWPDNTKPEQVAFTDEREYYAVEAYSNTASLSWRLLVNDDMDALSRIPSLAGAAAARTVNATVWAIITANPTMQDSVALFSAASGARKKTNLGTTGVVSETTLNEGRKIMRLQVGVNTKGGNASESILNLTPKYLVGPAAIEGTIMRQINSDYVPEASLFQTVNQFKTLVPVIEPLLDANSASAWYLFADSSQIDTVELSFLQGHESPVTDSWSDPETSALMYRITQTFGAKAIDWRGMFKNV